MRTTAWLFLALATACNDGGGGSTIRATPAPELLATPVLSFSEKVDIEGIPHVRAGATITVQLDIDAPEGFDEDASSVSFTGVPLEQTGDDTWTITLTGDEGEGIKTLDIVLVDELGQQSRVRFDGDSDTSPIEVGFDFTPPRANCLLSPDPSNGEQEVTFTVLPSEPLKDLRATPSATDVTLINRTDIEGDGVTWDVRFTEDANIPFDLTVEATDLVGNPPVDTLCDDGHPRGEHLGERPDLDGDPVLTVDFTPEVFAGTTRKVGEGAVLEVTFAATASLDIQETSVQMGEIPLTWNQTDQLWRGTVGPTTADGTKPLSISLVDAAGNRRTVERSNTRVIVDRTAPSASCALSPDPASGQDTVQFTLIPTEPLGHDPTVTSPDVTTGTPTRSGGRWLTAVQGTPETNVDYTLSVTLADEVGNEASDDAVCAAEDRSGQILGVPPALSTDPVVDVSPAVAIGEQTWARAGAVVTVTLDPVDDLDVQRTQVLLSGLELVHQADNTWQSRPLADGDGDGPKDLELRLRDPAGNLTPLTYDDVMVLDTTPPGAACTNPRSPGRGDGDVFLDVTPTEPLVEAFGGVLPTYGLTTTGPIDVSPDPSVSGNVDRLVLVRNGTAIANSVAYSVTLRGRDRVGNEGDLCTRSGLLDTRPPALTDLTLASDGPPAEDGVLWANEETTITVSWTADEPLREESASLGGTPANPAGEVVFPAGAGNGAKPLDLVIEDAAGNETRIQQVDRPELPVVTLDTVAPTASCRIQPLFASALDPITLEVVLAEPLADCDSPGAAPGRTCDATGLVVLTTGTDGDPSVAFTADNTEPGALRQVFTLTPAAGCDTGCDYAVEVDGVDRAGNAPEDRDAGGQTLRGLCGLPGDGLLRATVDATPPSSDLALQLTAFNAIDRGGRLHLDPQGTGPDHRLELRILSDEPLDTDLGFLTFGDLPLTLLSEAGSGGDPLTDPPIGGFVDPDSGRVYTYEYVYAYEPDGSESDGVKRLRGTIYDLAGNPAAIDGEGFPSVDDVYVDYTPPLVANAILQRTPFFPPAEPGDGFVRFTDVDGLTGQPVRGTLLVIATEPLGGPPVLATVGAEAFAPTLDDVSGSVARWTIDTLPATEGPYGFTVSLADDLGNVGAPQSLTVAMIVDRTGPDAAPDVNTPGRVVYTRAPNGTVASGAGALFRLQGDPGAALSQSVLVVRNEAGALVTSTQADSDGSFGPIDLPSDLPGLRIAQLDDAGNSSESVMVRDGRWVANLQGKALGSVVANPHAFYETRDLHDRNRGDADATETVALLSGRVLTRGGARWQEVTPILNEMPLRRSAAVATDPVLGRAILFGGTEGSGVRGGTYQWSGTGWVLAGGSGPSDRSEHAMAWDPQRQQVLLFGGKAPSGGFSGLFDPLGDTWAYEDGRWVELAPPGDRPEARARAAMVTDPVRGVVVLFGGARGINLNQPSSDTWIWDGTRWTEVATTGPKPEARLAHCMGWDPVSGRIIVTGGLSSNVQDDIVDTTWAWDGDAWTPLVGQEQAVFECRMATDPRRGELLMYGGLGAGGGPRTSTLQFDGSGWVQRDFGLPFGEPGRESPVLFYDPMRQTIVLDGGDGYANQEVVESALGWSPEEDEWIRVMAQSEGPVAQRSHAMATDEDREEVVMVSEGGETWVWDGWRWELRATTGPPARTDHDLAWLEDDGKVLLYGGEDGFTLPLGDTWVWDGTSWSEPNMPPGTQATARTNVSLARDPQTDGVVTAGNAAFDSVQVQETQVYETGSGWATLSGPDPSLRDHTAMAARPWLGDVLLFGGQILTDAFDHDDTWRLTPGGWVQDTTSFLQPEGRQQHGLVADPSREEVVLFGGASVWDPGFGFALYTFSEGVWRHDDTSWWEVDVAGPGPGRRLGHAMAWDPVREGSLVHGGFVEEIDVTLQQILLDDTWLLDMGADSRPGHRFDADWTAAASEEATLRAVRVTWTAAGTGMDRNPFFPDDDVLADGIDLLVWDVDHWSTLAQFVPDSVSPAPSCVWIRRAASDGSSDGCTTITDRQLLDRIVVGAPRRALRLAVRTTTPSNRGFGLNPNFAWASVTTDEVEVEIAYRLPAED